MKPGCFLKVVATLTVFIAVLAYLIQNKKTDFMLSPFKNFVRKDIVKEIDNKLVNVKKSPEKDSLKVIADNFVRMDSVNFDGGNTKLTSVLNEIKTIAKDSIVTKQELENLKKLINSEIKNERSTEE